MSTLFVVLTMGFSIILGRFSLYPSLQPPTPNAVGGWVGDHFHTVQGKATTPRIPLSVGHAVYMGRLSIQGFPQRDCGAPENIACLILAGDGAGAFLGLYGR